MSTSEDSSDSSQHPSGRMDIIKYNVHTCFQNNTRDVNKRIAEKLALPLHILLLNLDGNMNIAMTIRTAAVLGCSDVWIVGRRKYDARPEVGAKHYVRVHKILDIEEPMEFFRITGMTPILVEQGGSPLESMNFKPYIREGNVCLVMGSESHGIPKSWLDSLKDVPRISISQYGMIRSLNVSIAASIIIYEYLKQWREMRIDV
jgi:tRNA G18 (ribose-2'-O)-methylase SpoU